MNKFLLISIVSMCFMGCQSENFKAYVAADKKTYEVVAKEYKELVAQKYKKDPKKIKRRNNLMDTWGIRIEKAQDYLEEK